MIPCAEIVVCEEGEARTGVIVCQFGREITADPEQFVSSFRVSQQISDLDLDLLSLASAVAFADRTVRRKRSVAWERRIHIQMMVYEPSHWESSSVKSSLLKYLGFLTGDCWYVDFVQRPKRRERFLQNSLLPLPSEKEPVGIPFSGGLDSFAAAQSINHSNDHFPLLVTTKQSSVVATLAECLSKKSELPIPPLTIPIKFQGLDHPEQTYRTRTFLYFSNAAVAVRLFGGSRVAIGEGGQGSLGPSITPFAGEHPFRATHPRATLLLQRFLLALWGESPSFEHPHLFSTKGETLRRMLELDQFGGVEQTRSCSRNIPRTKGKGIGAESHCGVCSGCLFRRMSLYNAHPNYTGEQYCWSDLRCEQMELAASPEVETSKLDKSIAIRAILDLACLAREAQHPNSRGVRNVCFEVASGLGASFDEAHANITNLLASHRCEWERFIDHLGHNSWVSKIAGGSNEAS